MNLDNKQSFMYITGTPSVIVDKLNSLCSISVKIDVIKFRESLEDSYALVKITKL